MCIIAYKPANKKMFTEDAIKTMFSNNPDGAGLMYLKPDHKVHIEKGFFNVDDLLKYVRQNKAELKDANVVMHFRIATSGKKDALGCHPYPVWSYNKEASTNTLLAMCHNGILDSYGYPGNSEINDTQVFIDKLLRKLPHNFLNNVAITDMIEKTIGTNKLAFLDANGIHLIGKFVEDDGYYYSNTSYKPRIWALPNYYSRPRKNEGIPVGTTCDDEINLFSQFGEEENLSQDEFDMLYKKQKSNSKNKKETISSISKLPKYIHLLNKITGDKEYKALVKEIKANSKVVGKFGEKTYDAFLNQMDSIPFVKKYIYDCKGATKFKSILHFLQYSAKNNNMLYDDQLVYVLYDEMRIVIAVDKNKCTKRDSK